MKPSFLRQFPEIVLSPQATLRQAMEVFTNRQVGIVIVASKDRRLKGIVVDFDLRRALLRGETMLSPVSRAMNPKPETILAGTPAEEIAERFRKKPKAYIPVVDRAGRIVDVAAWSDYLSLPESHPNWVVIMAGGRGRRLRPYTETTPKPMMLIGDKPLLELVLERLVASGFRRFIFAVNYLADRIRDHFGDGSKWKVEIEYVAEPRELGTAGALSLIKRDLGEPFIVMNGDLLTKVNFRALLDFHHADGNLATLCVREYDLQVPFGVVQLQEHKLRSISEKPIQRFFVNAGICVLEPKALASLKRGEPCDMPDFLETLQKKHPGQIGCFPVQEYWLDIGRLEDYQRAVEDYDHHFRRPASATRRPPAGGKR
ncbi:MAG: nucleotidyltransferase family protein [Elusimicrobia bacterium]|nr:nucleotidyltransferase family protein [Elusimicrobiota bacterium]